MSASNAERDALTEPAVSYQPLVPVAVAIAAGICADRLTSMPGLIWLAGAAASLVAWTFCFRRERRRGSTAALLVGAAMLGAAWHHARWSTFPTDGIGHWATDLPEPVCVRGRLVDQPQLMRTEPDDPLRPGPGLDRTVCLVAVGSIRSGAQWKPASGKARLVVSGHMLDARPGDTLVVYGTISTPPAARNPGQFDYRSYLRSRRVRTSLFASHPDCVEVEPTERAWQPAGLLGRVRNQAERTLWNALDHTRAGLAAALLLGGREHLDEDQREAFVRTGTMHLLSISGLHVGILAGAFWICLNLLGVSRVPAALSVAVATAAYVLLVEARPPVVRAVILTNVVCLGIVAVRRWRATNTLAAALLVVLALNPADLFHTGLQLSFLSVAALLWLASWTGRSKTPAARLARVAQVGAGWHRRLLLSPARFVMKGVIVTAAVWCVTLPLLMARFHLFSPAAFVLNAVLVPLVAMVLLSGFATLVAGVVLPPALGPFAWACDQGLLCIGKLVEWGAAAPGSYVYTAGPPGWWLAGFYTALGLLALSPALRQRKKEWMSLLILWCCAGLAAPLLRPVPRHMECVVLDVGHGLASVVHLPDGKTVLYDVGQLGPPRIAGQIVSEYLWSRGVGRIDAVLLSHADVDHFNGLPYLLERFPIGRVFVAPAFADLDQPAVKLTCNEIRRCGVPLRFCWAGDRLRLGGTAVAEILHPPARGVEGSDNANSLVAAISYAGRRVLLTGDLEGPGLERLLSGTAQKSDVLLAPHHGSAASNPPGLRDWARPEVVVVSRRASRAPAAAVIDYRRRGTRVLSTGESGYVRVVAHGDGRLTVDAPRESAPSTPRRYTEPRQPPSHTERLGVSL